MDKSILEELRANCRITYRALVDKHDISSNAIKRRIDRLIEAVVIDKFTIQLSLAMMNAERILSVLYTDCSENTTELGDKADKHLLVQTV
jgi:DNA-binding Lrp family transcriptional regulator